jgi:hypothetical protein
MPSALGYPPFRLFAERRIMASRRLSQLQRYILK